MSAEGKALKKESYQLQAQSQYAELLTGPLSIAITMFFGTKRKADWDNFQKLTMDALTGIVFVDDIQIVEAHVRKEYDKARPRVEVAVSPAA